MMRILGIDYGDRHIGLAISDVLQLTAQPFGVYKLTGRKKDDALFFQDLVTRNGVQKIIVGDPIRMDGSAGSRSEKTREFGAWLEQAVGKPVVYMDERLTTREAHHILREKNVRGRKKKSQEDQISAVIILATYLERNRSESHVS